MAVRDRNMFAWQAYVITMAFVSVGLLLGMFFLWRSYSDLSTQFEDNKNQLQTARSQVTTSEARVQRLKAMLGDGDFTAAELEDQASQFANDEELAKAEADFAELMKLFPPGQSANERNLIKLPRALLETIRIRNEQVDGARERETKLLADLTERVKSETAAREDAVAAQKKAEADLAASRQSHADEIKRLNSEKEEALAKFAEYRREFESRLTKLTQDNQELVADNAKHLETIEQQKDELNQFKNPDFASPQGVIVKVVRGGDETWINLGSDDGLRVGVPFSVIDESAVNVSEADPKAKLVVTSIVDRHLARARITSSDYRNPIVTGDKIYSPAWRPGRVVGFALVGKMDINGDGRDDTEQIRELIRLAGGKIDEEMDTNGKTSGPGMTPSTSFLVLGTDLSVSAAVNDALQQQQIARAGDYAAFQKKASERGIIQISLDKLLGYLKIEGSDRTVPLGSDIRASDFEPRGAARNPPVSRGSVSEIFQKRP